MSAGARKWGLGALALGVVMLSACGDTARLPESAGYGPNPQLPPPNKTLVPTLNVAPATCGHEKNLVEETGHCSMPFRPAL